MSDGRSRVLRSAWVLALLRAGAASAVGGALLLVASPAAAITVDTTADEFDNVDPLTGCSLREAVEAVNTGADFGGCVYDGNLVYLANDVYALDLTGPAEDNNVTGDLDIRAPIRIYGYGA